MKYILLTGLLLLTLWACAKAGDMRVLELDSGKYTVQIKDQFGDWEWVAQDHSPWDDIGWIKYRGGLLLFDNENEACDYKEKIEQMQRITRTVKCKPQEGE